MVKRLSRVSFLTLISVIAFGLYSPAAARVADDCYMEGYTKLYRQDGSPILWNAFNNAYMETGGHNACADYAQVQFRGATTWYYCAVNPNGVDGHIQIAAWFYPNEQVVWPFNPGFYFHCCGDYSLNCS